MKAIGYYEPGDIERENALVAVERPGPEPGAHDLIVRVKAVSVNPVDAKTRKSAQPDDREARVLGFDAAGVVQKVGSAVSLFAPGDEVFYAGAIDRPGSNAELQAVDERIVGRKPSSLNWAQAAALPLTSITAWEILFDRMRVPYGEKTGTGTLLVINGAGGVGSMLVQLARRLTGLRVIATASRDETRDWALRMGAHEVIDHHKPLDEEMERVGAGKANYVAGLTATGEHRDAIVELIAPQGVLALIDDPESFDIMPFKRKAVTVAWELMFTRSLFQTSDMIEQHRLLNEISALVDDGLLQTTMTDNLGPMSAETLIRAHRAIESGKSHGKIVMEGL